MCCQLIVLMTVVSLYLLLVLRIALVWLFCVAWGGCVFVGFIAIGFSLGMALVVGVCCFLWLFWLLCWLSVDWFAFVMCLLLWVGVAWCCG